MIYNIESFVKTKELKRSFLLKKLRVKTTAKPYLKKIDEKTHELNNKGKKSLKSLKRIRNF